ncbi:MAG: hypothetical protein Q9169_004727 [Polycauliona sp. 2 TL-2023]
MDHGLFHNLLVPQAHNRLGVIFSARLGRIQSPSQSAGGLELDWTKQLGCLYSTLCLNQAIDSSDNPFNTLRPSSNLHYPPNRTVTMAYPPMTHPCAAYPSPMHSARLSTRWSRHSQLSNEDWREGGMGTPLIHTTDLPLPPTTLGNDFDTIPTAVPPPTPRKGFRQSIRNSWRSSFIGGGGGGGGFQKHRWSILSTSSTSPIPSQSHADDATPAQPTPILRKRKRWSNAIGSTTATFVGSIGSNRGSFASSSADGEEVEVVAEVEVTRKRAGKRERFLYGMAMSFGGLGASGRVIG